MRSATPKVLHPLCGRPLVALADRGRARGRRGQVVVVDGPKRRARGPSARRRRARRPAGARRHRRRRARGRGAHIGARRHRRRAHAATCRSITADAIARARRGARGAAAPRRRCATDVLDDPTRLRPRRPRRRRQRRARRRDQDAGRRDAEELAIREVNAGIYAFDGGALLDALARLAPDNAQGELYLPDVLPLLRDDGRASPRTSSTTRRSRSASTTASTSPRVRALAQRAHPRRATCARASRSSTRASTVDRRRRRDRRATRCRAVHAPARRDARSASGCHDRPAHDADRRDARRRRHASCTPTSTAPSVGATA